MSGRGLGAVVRRVGKAPRRVLARSKPSGRGRRPLYGARHLAATVKLQRLYEWATLPVVTVSLLHDRNFHRSYRLTWRRKFELSYRMFRNTAHIETGTSHRAHLAMAAKLFSIPPDVEGVIVEAGCWKGGSTANLSLIAAIVGRDLVVYDSFEGLPKPAAGDRWASEFGQGAFRGELEEVTSNVSRYGDIDRCHFRKGWFSETLADHTEPVVLAFVDVDHQASMHQCLLGLWPHLADEGYFFVDEYLRLDYCAVFFSERFWHTYFDRPPPGLMGAGTGVPLGQHFVGPYRNVPPMQAPSSIGWTRKDFYGEWDYHPDDAPAQPYAGGRGAARGRDGWTTTTLSTEERDELTVKKLFAKMTADEQAAALERAWAKRSGDPADSSDAVPSP